MSASIETLIAILCVKLTLRPAVRACQASQTSYDNYASQLSGHEANWSASQTRYGNQACQTNQLVNLVRLIKLIKPVKLAS